MSLTLKAEQALKAVGLVSYFDRAQASWQELAQHTYDFVKANFPTGEPIRRDDVAEAMQPILEVHKAFGGIRDAKKLTQKYWVSDFADLIMDRVWDNLTK